MSRLRHFSKAQKYQLTRAGRDIIVVLAGVTGASSAGQSPLAAGGTGQAGC